MSLDLFAKYITSKAWKTNLGYLKFIADEIIKIGRQEDKDRLCDLICRARIAEAFEYLVRHVSTKDKTFAGQVMQQ